MQQDGQDGQNDFEGPHGFIVTMVDAGEVEVITSSLKYPDIVSDSIPIFKKPFSIKCSLQFPNTLKDRAYLQLNTGLHVKPVVDHVNIEHPMDNETCEIYAVLPIDPGYVDDVLHTRLIFTGNILSCQLIIRLLDSERHTIGRKMYNLKITPPNMMICNYD